LGQCGFASGGGCGIGELEAVWGVANVGMGQGYRQINHTHPLIEGEKPEGFRGLLAIGGGGVTILNAGVLRKLP